MKKIILLFILTVFTAAGVLAKDIYYCPMHPHYTSEKSGSCPICSMTLVKRENAVNDDKKNKGIAKTAGYVPVHIDTNKQQIMGLRTSKLLRKPFIKTVHAPGYVTHDLELYDSELEYLEAWHEYFMYTGQGDIGVKRSDDWRTYYEKFYGRKKPEEYRKIQQRLIKAEYALRHAGVSEAELDKLRVVKHGSPWVASNIIDYSYWVYAEIFESDLGFVDVGQKAVITIPAYGETLEGTVRSVADLVDPNSRTVRVRIELPKSNVELKENMFVNVTMSVELDDSLVVPRDAVMMTGTRAIVFIQKDNNIFVPKEVVTGWESDGFVQIKKGLQENDTVVSAAAFLVDSESRMQSALSGMEQGGDQ